MNCISKKTLLYSSLFEELGWAADDAVFIEGFSNLKNPLEEVNE